MIRKAAWAGQFYPATRSALERELKIFSGPHTEAAREAVGAVSPHAGYAYSGYVAASVYSSVGPKKRYVIIGPNHTGLGQQFGISTADSWQTPLGEARIDRALADCIRKKCDVVMDNDLSHAREHSIEVQLPFIQYSRRDFAFVPMVVSDAPIEVYRRVGQAIAESIKELGIEDDALIVASSDMTHYESQESAKSKDRAAIGAILKLDDAGLIKAVSEMDISMCGYAPAAIMLAAAKELGAVSARLVKYQTSGDVTGDYSSVVGYAGIIITKGRGK